MHEKCFNRIYQEIKYYATYDQVIGKERILSFLTTLKENIFQIISKKEQLTWEEILVHYFYSHTNGQGEIVSLEVSSKQQKDIACFLPFYQSIRKQFITQLFKHNDPLYFLDVDNTLTDYAVLSPEKVHFISNWNKKKNIILSTGKAPFAIQDVIHECALEDNYYSCLNGSIVAHQDELIMVAKIGEVSQYLIEQLNQTDMTYITYYENIIHIVKELTEENIALLKKYSEWHIDPNPEVDYGRIVKIMVFILDDHSEKSKKQEEIVQKMISPYPNLICVRTAYHCYEILDVTQHKGNTVKIISEMMGKYYRSSVGVGDSMNDLPMLNYVGFPYMVSNASDELQSYQFEIPEGSRDIDIVNVLKKYDK